MTTKINAAELLEGVTEWPWSYQTDRLEHDIYYLVTNNKGEAELGTWFVARVQWEKNARLIAAAPALAAEVVRLEKRVKELELALKTLVDLNDGYAPFGGEFLQDRIDRAWVLAKSTLAAKQDGE